jgi:phosphatidylglycerophosphate synthase
MLDEPARRLKNRLLEPFARLFAPFSPVTLSLIGLALVGPLVWLLVQGWYGAAALVWLLNRFFDGIDGIVARRNGRQTDFGGYVDILADFVAYAAVPLALAHGLNQMAVWYATTLLLAAFYLNAASWMYLAALLEKRNQGAQARGETTSITMPDGIVGGFLTILFYLGFMLWPARVVWLMGLMAVLVLAGVGQRLFWARQQRWESGEQG